MTNKPKILILFCGGTIIMTESGSGALVVSEKEQAINSLLNLEPNLKEIAELAVHYIDNIDSSNMKPEHWDKIASVIAEKYEEFDGFVITHGTDTMAYTSSALSYALGNLGKPVVLTGSQIPGNKIETDARRNFVNAVRVATLNLAGVFLVFDEEIILGSRATKESESRLDAFETVNWDLVGEIRIDIRLSHEAKPRHSGKLNLQLGFETNVAALNLFPGMPKEVIENILNNGIKGLVLSAFGSGNLSYEYLEALKKAKEKKIAVVVDTQCMQGATLMHLYDVGKSAMDTGVIQAFDMSFESAITKLMWALKRAPYEEIEKLMHTNYTGEINKEGVIY